MNNNRSEPAIVNGFGEGFDEVAGDIQEFELWEAAYGVWEGRQLIWVHVQHHHVQQSRRQRLRNVLFIHTYINNLN